MNSPLLFLTPLSLKVFYFPANIQLKLYCSCQLGFLAFLQCCFATGLSKYTKMLPFFKANLKSMVNSQKILQKIKYLYFFNMFGWNHLKGKSLFPKTFIVFCHNPNSTSTQLNSWVWHENDFNPPPPPTHHPPTQTQCQQYHSCYWSDFNQTLNLGSWDEQQQQ